MSVSVRKAGADDLYPVYELLRNSTLNSAPLPFEARKRMFRPVWGGDEGYYGYVMEAEGEVVGFLGTLFTEREINGTRHKFCEIHSWYVRDDYRNESIKLFLPVMSLRKVTLLNYTPTQTVYDISKKFGWNDLETQLLMFLPIPTPRSLGAGVRVETRKHAIVQYLDETDKQIFLDHDDVPCSHFLVRENNGTGYSYIILKKMWLSRLRPFGRIIYASDKRMLLNHIDYLKMLWCLRLGLTCVVIDRDEVEAEPKPAFSKVIDRDVPSLYLSKNLKPADIKPPLYTLPLLIGYRLH
ncbi:GNAT family N-acetyltransferase [Salinactinospora qingdaonensis]|uniref:N-acetyltransferase domain-containing protein n=1 Tax=Salinactinospora qingdaonensis TaxID=702744 RepID=A0ABP7G110_9ACTN